MAKIVLGIGMSHSPMMGVDGSKWETFAEADYQHPMLYDFDGNKSDYKELEAKVGDRYRENAKTESLIKLHGKMTSGFSRLAKDFEDANLDTVIVISNDHPGEWLNISNVPALAIFYGEKVISGKINIPPDFVYKPEVVEEMSKDMGMDKHHIWPGAKDVALHLIDALIEKEFDIGAMKEVDDPSQAGHGHGFGFVVTQLMKKKLVPMVPIYLNSWPPNELTPSRCYDLGLALNEIIESMPKDLRIGIIASGGLSHFVTDTDLDTIVINALKTRDEKVLRELPRHRLKAGNSEIRNWVILEAALRNLNLKWYDYNPVFRTPVGTGIGMTFASWS